MSQKEVLNKRKFPRVNFPCLIILRSRQGEDATLTHTENIGIGGVGVILKHSIKLFCPVELELDLMDLGEHIHCQGKVVWCIQRKNQEPKKPLFYDVGIEFQSLPEKQHGRIEQVVQRLHKYSSPTPFKL